MINNNIAIILVAPQLGENIGASARAMKNFGLRDLRIVAPRDGWPNKKAESMSVGAIDIINQAKGESYRCNESHILSLKYSSGRSKGVVRDISIKEYLSSNKETRKLLNGYKSQY
jgi:tRNA C32,U32 (ribose-2'-O)-methylase TrmJ